MRSARDGWAGESFISAWHRCLHIGSSHLSMGYILHSEWVGIKGEENIRKNKCFEVQCLGKIKHGIAVSVRLA
jgi:hypothetical protein